MVINSIRYVRRFNLGDYEHEEMEVSGVLEDGEDLATAIHGIQVLMAKASIPFKRNHKKESEGKK